MDILGTLFHSNKNMIPQTIGLPHTNVTPVSKNVRDRGNVIKYKLESRSYSETAKQIPRGRRKGGGATGSSFSAFLKDISALMAAAALITSSRECFLRVLNSGQGQVVAQQGVPIHPEILTFTRKIKQNFFLKTSCWSNYFKF